MEILFKNDLGIEKICFFLGSTQQRNGLQFVCIRAYPGRFGFVS